MAPGRAEAIAQPAAANLGVDDRMIGVEAHAEQPRVGALVLAEADDKPRGRGLGAGAQAFEMRIVALEDGDAAGLKTVEDFRLGVGDRIDAGEILDVDSGDRGDDRDMRAHHAAQRRDLVRVIHADLENAEARRFRHARQASAARPNDYCRRRPRRARRPPCVKASRSASFVDVLPTEPVTATTRALVRARAATPSRSSAGSTSRTT